MNRLVLSATCAPKASFEELVDLAVRTGIKAVETFTTWTGSRLGPGVLPAEEARAILDERGVDMPTMNLVNLTGPEAMPRLDEEMAYAAKIGVKAVNVKGGSRDQAWSAFLPLVSEAVSMAQSRGLGLNLGNHPANRIEGIEDYARVLDELGERAPRILLDSGHFHTAGESPIAVVRRWPGRIGLVHLNDRQNGKGVSLGAGELDCPALFAALRNAGYSGELVLELEGGAPDPEAQAAEVVAAKAFVKTLLHSGEEM